MSRKPWFWILLIVVCAGALAFAVSRFSKAFPIVSIDLAMDRAQALASARTIADKLHLGPGGRIEEAATFATDDTAKTFVELDGGGAGAFRDMLANHLYEAYTWRVRHFREGETREVAIRFRPDGQPYGFREKLKEDEPGASVSSDAARGIAEAAARRDWGLDLTPYTALAPSLERKPGGRVDHTFYYERLGARVGEGRYRVKLVVSGDRLTELTHDLRVPEAFARRYEELRSANNAIAIGGTVALVLLYVIGGCIIGLVLLMRAGWVVWGPAMITGAVVSGVQALAAVNELPLDWIGYDTALSRAAFLSQQITQIVLLFLADAGIVMLSFAAAESLGRKAFPHHPQFWKMPTRAAASSRSIVGRATGGALFTGFELGYVIAFYMVATTIWKWWVPAESLVEPNVLATYLPWLSAVAPSLHAGMWEEALFRAVPLACAALIGQRTGKRGLWIGIGLVVESIIFGCGHANYPSNPPYSRPVELFLPSLIWGFVYLRYGLLPSIVTHYLFDLALFSLPLFASNAAAHRLDQTMVIVCGALPVAYVAFMVARAGGLTELPEALRNRGWIPPVEAIEDVAPVAAPARAGLSPMARRILLIAGLAGVAAWAFGSSFKSDAPVLGQRRAQAIATGTHALADRGYHGQAPWQRLANTDEDGIQSVFVWRALGDSMYHALIGRDLLPPTWNVRVARFVGKVDEKAEEWQAWIGGDGQVRRLQHILPQEAPGASLTEAEARTIAHTELARRFQLGPDRVREVSAVSAKQKARLDWTFTFADPAPPRLARGERRLSVEIAGDQVVDAHRFVFVPEDWQREFRGEGAMLNVLNIVRGLAVALVVVSAAVFAVLLWSRRALRPAFTLKTFAALFVIGLAVAANRWPQLMSNLSTAQPYQIQVSVFVVALFVSQLLVAAVIALVAGWSHHELAATSAGAPPARPLDGIALGFAAAGVVVAASALAASSGPLLPNTDAASMLLPWLGEALRGPQSLLMRGSILLATIVMARVMSENGTRRVALSAVLLGVVGGLAVSPASAGTIHGWLGQAAVAGVALVALDYFVLRWEPRLIPWAVAVLVMLPAIKAIVIQPHPDARLGAALTIVATAVVLVIWNGALRAPSASAPTEPR